jgi:adenylylsulfate kinase
MSHNAGITIWLTGLSGAGKSTLATALAARLHATGRPVEVLDGDEVRRTLSQELGFSRADRDTNVRRIAYVAKLLTRNGVTVVVAAISPFADTRTEARRTIGRFLEVHVKASLETCAARDPKGLYANAVAGAIPAFTGISDPYEPPLAPDLVIDTERDTVEQGVARIVEALAHG